MPINLVSFKKNILENIQLEINPCFYDTYKYYFHSLPTASKGSLWYKPDAFFSKKKGVGQREKDIWQQL